MGITRFGVAAFISPKIPEITTCVCVDVAEEFPNREKWLRTFFMKVAFQNHVPQAGKRWFSTGLPGRMKSSWTPRAKAQSSSAKPAWEAGLTQYAKANEQRDDR